VGEVCRLAVGRGKVTRLWDRDARLWTGGDQADWLGRLDIVAGPIAQHDHLEKIAKEVHDRGCLRQRRCGMRFAIRNAW